MPLQHQNAEIILFHGLDQKRDPKGSVPGSLESAVNVEFEKQHALNKRRGYAKITMTTEALGLTPEETFVGVATYEDELVVFGYDKAYAVASRTGALPASRAIVQRGPYPRGNIRAQDVVAARTSNTEVSVG